MSEIYLEKTENRENFTKKVMDKFKNEFFHKKVLIKPSVVSFEPYPTTTHPDVLRSVIETLKNFDCKIIVADGPALDSGDPEKIIGEHFLNKICKEFELKLLNLHKFEFKEIKTEFEFSLNISTLPREVDYIISLPVLKAHPLTNLTGALKNQFGLLHSKDRDHSRLHQTIAAINKEVKVDLFIMDAVETYINSNEKRRGGKETKLGYMLAGKDPVALDSLGLELLGKVDEELEKKKTTDIEHIICAEKLGIGSRDYEVGDF